MQNFVGSPPPRKDNTKTKELLVRMLLSWMMHVTVLLAWIVNGEFKCWNASTNLAVICPIDLDDNFAAFAWPTQPIVLDDSVSRQQFEVVNPLPHSTQRNSELLLCRRGALQCDPAALSNTNSKFYTLIYSTITMNNITSFVLPYDIQSDEYTAVFSTFYGNDTLRVSTGKDLQVMNSKCTVLIPPGGLVTAQCYFSSLDRYLILTKRSNIASAPLLLSYGDGTVVDRDALHFNSIGDSRFPSVEYGFNSQSVNWAGELALMGGSIGITNDSCLPQFVGQVGSVPQVVATYDTLVCLADKSIFVTLEARLEGEPIVILKYVLLEQAAVFVSISNQTGTIVAVLSQGQRSGRIMFVQSNGLDWFSTFHLGGLLRIATQGGGESTCVLSRSARSSSFNEIEYDTINSTAAFSATSVSCDSDFGMLNLLRVNAAGDVQVDFFWTSSNTTKVLLNNEQLIFETFGGGGSFILQSPTSWSLDSIIGQSLYVDSNRYCVVALNRKHPTDGLAPTQVYVKGSKARCETNAGFIDFIPIDDVAVMLVPSFISVPFHVNTDESLDSSFQSIYVSSTDGVRISHAMKDLLGLRLELVSMRGNLFEPSARCIVQFIPPIPTPAPTVPQPTPSPSFTYQPSVSTSQPTVVVEQNGMFDWGVFLLAMACIVYSFVRCRRSWREAKLRRDQQFADEQQGLDGTYLGRKVEEWSFRLSNGMSPLTRSSRKPPPQRFQRISQDDDEEDVTTVA